MINVIDLFNFIYTPKIYHVNTIEELKKVLPSSKTILNKLNIFVGQHPDFYKVLQTNLWKIHPNPTARLTELLPLEIWQIIDSYNSFYPYEKVILLCKKYYITALQNQIEEEIYLVLVSVRKSILYNNLFNYYYDLNTMEKYKSFKKFLNDYKVEYYL